MSSSVDGLTSKTAKAAVSNFIPVVGKIMGDTVETVIGCSNILKNSVGAIGIIIVLGIVLAPIIKIFVLWISFQLTSALCEAVADVKIDVDSKNTEDIVKEIVKNIYKVGIPTMILEIISSFIIVFVNKILTI